MTATHPGPPPGPPTVAAAPAASDASPGVQYNLPPDEDEVWSYVAGENGTFLIFSALSKLFLGTALVFLSVRGQWLLMFLPFGVLVIVGSVISLVWATQVRPFDRAAHRRRVGTGRWRHEPVDVFIATCGEDPAVIDHTIFRAVSLRHPGGVHVYVLDDRGSDEVRAAAETWGATYLARPDRGWMKKAGNLHHAYGLSSSPLIVVLDADFAVRDDFLEHTVPYFDDPRVGIVQTPQFFRVSRTNWVERGAASQQEQFYRIGMRARDRREGAICVGTNAVYRRSALDERGGMALLEHSEDIFTGMKVVDAAYRVMYLPLPLAAGSAPTSTTALASQQYRWARGNFALLGTPLFKRLALTPMQRLSIWDGWIFYVTSALSPVVALAIPIVALAEAPHAVTLGPTAMLIPALFTEFVLQPRWLILSDGPAARRVGVISQMAHLFALRDHLTDREQEWIPTGDAQQGAHRQATDRIPQLVAGGAVIGFAATMLLIGIRVAEGKPLIDVAPVGILAMAALKTALGTTRAARRSFVRRAAPPAGRDFFLDAIRAFSILRVMFWHGLGYWWLSWTFSAMPAVFYVSGAALAASMRSKPIREVVSSRLRRLAPPYLAFAGVVVGASVLAAPRGVWERRWDLLSYVVPYRSPARLPWEEGWLSAPLWFLRALVVVLLLAPLVWRYRHRFRPVPTVVAWCASLVMFDVVLRGGHGDGFNALVQGTADVVCFGGFFAVGAVGHHLRDRLHHHDRVRALVALVVLTALATAVAPPIGMVVNNSNVTTALVGACWLMALLCVEDRVRQLGDVETIRRFVAWMSTRSMTVYLWHTTCVCIAYYLIGQPRSLAGAAVLMVVFTILLVGVVGAMRPLEGRGTGSRVPRPLGYACVVGVVAMLTTQPTLFPKGGDEIKLPVPSGRPTVEVVRPGTAGQAAPIAAAGGATTDAAAGDAPADAPAWLAEHGVDGALAVVVDADGLDVHEVGQVDDIGADDPFQVFSVTKTMVAAVALQLVGEGRLTLDGPLPAIDGLPRSATSQLSLRRLLSHSSGLADYRDAPGFVGDERLAPVDAVRLSIEAGDLSVTKVRYAASNYFLVGLVIEEVARAPLDTVLEQRLFAPLGLEDTRLINNSRLGFVGQASAGVVSTPRDLARWYDALMRRQVVLPPALLAEMLDGGPTTSVGLGAWKRCPCGRATAEIPTPWTYVFHDGSDVRVLYIPHRDEVMALRLSSPLYGAERVSDELDALVFALS